MTQVTGLASCIGLASSKGNCLEKMERQAELLLSAAGQGWVERRRSSDRRRITVRTFFQSGFTPRRRGGRRAGEQHLPIDWHEPHLLFRAMTILLLSVADAFFTLTLMTIGATEANPFLAFILNDHPQLFAIVKMGLTGGGVLVLVAIARARIFNVVKVSTVLHWLLVGYAALIFYEWSLLRTHL